MIWRNLPLLLLALVLSGTMAYFTGDVRTRNVITTRNVAIEVLEFRDTAMQERYPSEPVPMNPGQRVTKVAVVQNAGDVESWVRVKVESSVKLADGTDGDASFINIHYIADGWLKDGDYYYHKTPLPAGAVTGMIFDEVSFPTNLSSAVQGGMAYVTVSAQAVQVKNNNPVSQLTTHDDVAQINGWPS